MFIGVVHHIHPCVILNVVIHMECLVMEILHLSLMTLGNAGLRHFTTKTAEEYADKVKEGFP